MAQATVQLQNCQIAYEIVGSGDQSLLFLHGWLDTKSVWEESLAFFAADYRCFSLDFPGAGDSTNAEDVYDIPALVKLVASFCRAQEILGSLRKLRPLAADCSRDGIRRPRSAFEAHF